MIDTKTGERAGLAELRNSRLSGLASFGTEAAASVGIDALLRRACVDVTRGLEISHAKVLEYLPEEKKLLVRAGEGWAPDVVGQERLDAHLGSPAGYALQTGKPTIANDLAREDRFKVPDMLARHGVRSAVNVIIQTERFVFGVLEADSIDPREFDDRDVQFLQAYANMLAMAVLQNRLVEENRQLNERLNLLLDEMRHRTKNNNQLLASMLNLQSRRHQMLEVRQALEEVSGRVAVLNTIDELIQSTGNSEQIDVGRYLVAIVNAIFQIDAERASGINLQTEISQVIVNSRDAQALAMIANEFITNSFKYAFNGRAGTLSIRMTSDENDVTIEFADDGPGLAQGFKRGLGLQLIDAMARQLEAQTEWRSEQGARLRLRFRSEPASPGG